MKLVHDDDEVVHRDLHQFLEKGLKTQRFVMPPNAGANRLLVSDAAGIGTWTAASAWTLAVTDNLFSILDNLDPTKIAQFQCASITTGTTRTYTFPDASGTFALLEKVQTFTAAQTFAATSGTSVTVNPPSGTVTAFETSYSDTVFPSAPGSDEVWNLVSTISNAAATSPTDFTTLRIRLTMSNIDELNAPLLFGLNVVASFAGIATNAGGASYTMGGLRFNVSHTSSGGGSQGDLLGVQGFLQQSGTDPLNSGTVFSSRITVNAGTSVTTSTLYSAVAPQGSGSITTWNGLTVAAYTSGPTCSTARGINMGNITRGATSWSLAIGTSSSAGKSFHWAPFRFGDGTAPTHYIDIAAGTSTIAPIKMTSATPITTPVAGCQEFQTDDFFATITTGAARKAFVLDDGTRLTSGRVPFATTNGRLVDDADMTFATDTLTVTKIIVGGGASIASLNFNNYTPTLTNVANLTASTPYACSWFRVGNMVTVSGKADVDPTLTATATQLGISLPVASNFAAQEDCAGTAFASGIASQGAAIRADAANDRAEMVWISTDVTNQPMYFIFTYEIL